MRFPTLCLVALLTLVALPDARAQAPHTHGDVHARAQAAVEQTLRERHEARERGASTPAEAKRELELGNARFFDGDTRAGTLSASERRSYKFGQAPHTAILSCSDSRAPAEAIFDQGVGDLFVVRVAGNVATSEVQGSMEFAVANLGAPLVVVMGHEGCGAVTAAMLPQSERRALPAHLRGLLDQIAPVVADVPRLSDQKARERVAVIENIRAQMRALRGNPVLRDAIARGELEVIGAYYELRSGAVEFLDDESSRAR